jgi:hypothetical protein
MNPCPPDEAKGGKTLMATDPFSDLFDESQEAYARFEQFANAARSLTYLNPQRCTDTLLYVVRLLWYTVDSPGQAYLVGEMLGQLAEEDAAHENAQG